MPGMVGEELLGRRVVLRYRRNATDGRPPLSDAVGELTTLTDRIATVRTRTGEVQIPRADVVAARVVGPDRRHVLDLARIGRLGWRAAEQRELDGWWLAADRGWTGRANSVLPLRTPERPIDEVLGEVGRFYGERGLPAQIQVPLPARGLLDAELARRCWTVLRPTLVLFSPMHPSDGSSPTMPVDLLPAPDEAWLAAYHYRGGALPDFARALLTRHDQVRFAAVRDGGELVGIARGTVDDGWLGVTAVEVAPASRRSGVATALMRALSDWGAGQGATQTYLQVDQDNAAALNLYRALGFTEHHRYHYRVAPR